MHIHAIKIFFKILRCRVFFSFFRAAPKAYGGSQARSQIGAIRGQPMPTATATWDPSRAMSATYTTAHGNTGSLTH